MTIPSAQSLYKASGGVSSTAPFITILEARNPISTDIYDKNGQFLTGQRWINTVTNDEYYLDGYISAGGTVLANWKALTSPGTGAVQTLTGTSGGPVGPDIAGNITFNASGMTIAGTPATNTLTFTNTQTQGVIVVAADTGSITGTNLEISGGTTGLTTNAVSATQMNIQGILNVPHGGTDNSSFSIYAPICGGTTATGAFQSADSAQSNTGFVLTSTGGTSLPTWQPTGVSSSTVVIVSADVGSISGNNIEISGGTTGLTTNAVSATQMNIQGTLIVANGGTGDSSFTSNSVIISGATSTANLIPIPMSDGQLIIGATGGAPAAANLTEGSNITIISGSNSIIISAGGLGGSLIVNEQVFTSSATYIPTAGMVYCLVQCVAGGGAGGGCSANPVNELSTGGGGGGGEFASGIFDASTISISQSVIVGTGGVGSPASAGSDGTPTSFGTLISTFPGLGGGTFQSTVSSEVDGGLGGTGGTGGNFRCSGGRGFIGATYIEPGVSFPLGLIGPGGNSQLGIGGGGDFSPNFIQGQSGAGYGSGGGGSASNRGFPSNIAGGNGAHGVVTVTEYIVGGIASGIVVPAQGGTGVSNPTIHTVPIAEGSSAFNFVGPGTSGYVLMANGASADPSFEPLPTLTSPLTIIQGGTNAISMNDTDGVIYYDGTRLVTTAVGTSDFVLTSNGVGNPPTFKQIGLSNVTITAPQILAVNTTNTITGAAPILCTLPTLMSYGSVIEIVGNGIGGWSIIPESLQTIHIGAANSTTGPTGSISSTNRYDCVRLYCPVANTDWTAQNCVGNITVV